MYSAGPTHSSQATHHLSGLLKPREWARTVKRDTLAIWLAARDPRTPWYVKALAGLVAAYALSPIDLISDFIPVLGHLDYACWCQSVSSLWLRSYPTTSWRELRAEADQRAERPLSRAGAIGIALVWTFMAPSGPCGAMPDDQLLTEAQPSFQCH